MFSPVPPTKNTYQGWASPQCWSLFVFAHVFQSSHRTGSRLWFRSAAWKLRAHPSYHPIRRGTVGEAPWEACLIQAYIPDRIDHPHDHPSVRKDKMEAHQTSGRVLPGGVLRWGVRSAAELGVPDVPIPR